ncbi:MAG: GPR endopeptidase [Christensenellales bacterium]|jgi:spore protease
MSDIRTDLALEAREILEDRSASQIPGVEADINRDDRDITITRVRVTSNAGETALGKPRGIYVTLEAPNLRDRDPVLEERVSYCLARELKPLLPPIDRNFSALVVGLGNWNITPDALGPRVVSKMMVTRHLLKVIPDQVDERVRPVCALAPGVLGITGIETAEIIQGVVEKVGPTVVFIVDALASRRTDRISTTIQISDTGLNPGSGIGNKRSTLDRNSLGVPVIALGVPMVVYATTIVRDALEILSREAPGSGMPREETLQRMIDQVVAKKLGDLVVTPKEIDTIVDDVARILSMGLNLLIHDGVTIDEINRFLH